MDKEDCMRIKKFDQGGHSIKVKYVKTVRDKDGSEIFGQCNPFTNEIHVATQLNGMKLSEEVIEHTLCHERVHLMLMLMNEHELNSNEQFVDVMGMFLHHFEKSKR
jgi:hypothetical protein